MNKPYSLTGHCDNCQRALDPWYIRDSEHEYCLDCGEREFRKTLTPAESARRTVVTNVQPELFTSER